MVNVDQHNVQCSCAMKCSAAWCSVTRKWNSSWEVQRLSARCAEPQHWTLFRTKSIKHRIPPTFLGPILALATFFPPTQSRIQTPSNLFSQANFVPATFCPPSLSKFIFASTARAQSQSRACCRDKSFLLQLWSHEFSPGSPLSV